MMIKLDNKTIYDSNSLGTRSDVMADDSIPVVLEATLLMEAWNMPIEAQQYVCTRVTV